MTNQTAIAAIVACLLIALASPAEAKPKKPRPDSQAASQCTYIDNERIVCPGPVNSMSGLPRAVDANGNGAQIVGGRPPGCPHRYCGCEASLYLFGKIVPDLNLAANWIKKFPRSSPAPRMAAARPGHVMVLISHVSGNDWLVHDGNSGKGLTRRHVRSIRGYVVVNPNGTFASR